MGEMNIKIKLMPSSPDVNLEEIKSKAKELVEKEKGKSVNFQEEEIAFGLKSLIVSFILSENEELEIIENKLSDLDSVNSAEMIDIRRAL
ncbi:MAG: elongation factor 1-beta [archaeon]